MDARRAAQPPLDCSPALREAGVKPVQHAKQRKGQAKAWHVRPSGGHGQSSDQPPISADGVAARSRASNVTFPLCLEHPTLPALTSDIFIQAGAIAAERAARERDSTTRAEVEAILRRAAEQAGWLLNPNTVG